MTLRYRTSLRERDVDTSYRLALEMGRSVGVTRVTDITRLDRLGLPVFAAIRPDATRDSLCVSAGKGLTAAEAKIGALMEAIELAYAEPGRSALRPVRATPRALLGGDRDDAIVDFCPRRGVLINLDGPIDCVEAYDLISGRELLVPAELVFFPAPRLAGRRYFSSDGNGLTSGNSIDEATLHGLLELVERDAMSFHNLRDHTALVTPESLPAEIAEIAERLDAEGFGLSVRWLPSEFGLPVAGAVVWERGFRAATHVGTGCHVYRSIAVARAVSEAMQSRLTSIHGGRDDFSVRTRTISPWTDTQLDPRVVAVHSLRGARISYHEIPDFQEDVEPLVRACLKFVVGTLASKGIRHVLRAEHTPADAPLHVLRVLAPGLEFANDHVPRMGRRLKRFREALPEPPRRRIDLAPRPPTPAQDAERLRGQLLAAATAIIGGARPALPKLDDRAGRVEVVRSLASALLVPELDEQPVIDRAEIAAALAAPIAAELGNALEHSDSYARIRLGDPHVSIPTPPEIAEWIEWTAAMERAHVFAHPTAPGIEDWLATCTARALDIERGLGLAMMQGRLTSAARLARWAALVELAGTPVSVLGSVIEHLAPRTANLELRFHLALVARFRRGGA